jgi:hypothetical protein
MNICQTCSSSGCASLQIRGSIHEPPVPVCPRLASALPTTGNMLSEKLEPAEKLAYLQERVKVTWAESIIGERPPDEWSKEKRMFFDHFCNQLTLAEVARKYRVNKFTAKSRLARFRKEFSSAPAIVIEATSAKENGFDDR